MDKPTRAPWIAHERDANCWSIWGDNDGEYLGVVNNAADARLIAAAPDLYAVCMGLLEAFEHNDPWPKQTRKNAAESLRRVLARARGED